MGPWHPKLGQNLRHEGGGKWEKEKQLNMTKSRKISTRQEAWSSFDSACLLIVDSGYWHWWWIVIVQNLTLTELTKKEFIEWKTLNKACILGCATLITMTRCGEQSLHLRILNNSLKSNSIASVTLSLISFLSTPMLQHARVVIEIWKKSTYQLP